MGSTITQQISAVNQSIRDIKKELNRGDTLPLDVRIDLEFQLAHLEDAAQTLQQFRAMTQLLQSVKA